MGAAPSTGLRFWHLPADGARHGPALDAHLLLNLWIALALVVLLHGLLLAGTTFRRRAAPVRSNPLHRFTVEYLPLIAFAALFAFLGLRAHKLWAAERYTDADPSALQVEVVGEQFAWYFRYPGQDATFGSTRPALVAPGEGNPLGLDPRDSHSTDDLVRSQLVLPAGREVDLALNSLDVIHGFAVPELRLNQNAMPGQTAHIHFTAQVPGTYAVLCTQVCGLGHYRMSAALRVLPAAQFDAWLRAQGAAPLPGANP